MMKPAMVKSYNMHTGGVDRVDQQLYGVQALRKSYKWYKKLAFRLTLQGALNKCKIFEEVTGDKISFIDFLMKCIKLMIARVPHIILPANVVRPADTTRLTGRHFPSLIPVGAGGNAHRAHKRCRVCYARGKKSEKGHPLKTIYVCAECPDLPGLHPADCFRLFHTKLDFSTVE